MSDLAAYFHLMNANGAARVYSVAVKRGVLDALASNATMTVDDLATATNAAPRPLRLLLDALEALGLANRQDDRWSATMLARALAGGGYRNLGDEYWDHLTKLLDTDKPIVAMDHVADSERLYVKQVSALAWMLRPAAERFAHAVALPPNARILDLGAGSALWSLSLAAANRDSTVTAVDWPAVLEIAKQSAQSIGLGDLLSTIAGDFHKVELPADAFDVAIIANVTHLEPVDGNRDLFRKARAALNANGRIVIIDILGGDAAGDLNRTLYALGLALRTERGTVYSRAELEAMLTAEGFGAFEMKVFDVVPHAVGMLVASKLSDR